VLTHAYFVTYHTTAVIALRRLGTGRLAGRCPAPLRWPGWAAAVVFVIAYFWAWAETRAMANPWIEEQFGYRDLGRMLRYGSIFYACYFVVSFPMFFRLDEHPGERWSLGRTCVSALAAGMLVLVLLDFWAKIVGPP
jgi:cycloeucalenol cycloisomerase